LVTDKHVPAVTGNPTPGKPRARDAARTREDILEAAEALFAEHGYEATSLQAIGRKAGYSRGTPSYFFGSKSELYHAVFERAFARLQKSTRDAFASVEDSHSLEEALDAFLGAYLEVPLQFARLVEREVLRGGEVLAKVDSRLTAIHDNFEQIEQLAQRHFRSVDARKLYISIVALGWFPITQANAMLGALEVDANDPEFIAEYRRFAVRMLLDGLRAAEDDAS
jgi:AcrR family transcriptional regulator